MHSLFAERDADYYDFLPDGWEQTVERIPSLTAPAEERLRDAFDAWWTRHTKRIVELPDTGRVMDTRADLLDSFVTELKPLGILDRFQLAGVIASWWGDVQYDIRTLSHDNFSGVVKGWLTTIETAFADDDFGDARDKQRLAAEKRKARDHRVVPILIPDYLNELEAAEARRADLDAQVKAATATRDDEDDEPEETLSPTQLKALKADLAAAKRQVRHLEAAFIERLGARVKEKLDDDAETDLVLRIFKADLETRLDARVTAGRRTLIDRFKTWADKYAVTLHDLETQRNATATKLNSYLKDLGYA